MTTTGFPPRGEDLLKAFRVELEEEDRKALRRAKIGVGIRMGAIVFVVGYMFWLSSAVSRLDAPALTSVAATMLEERLPDLRTDLRDHAIHSAPELTDKARELFLGVPGHVRLTVQDKLLGTADDLVERFEGEVDAAISGSLDEQLQVMRAEFADRSPEEQLDAIILGVSDTFRETMTLAVDELYIDYAEEIQKLNGRLDHLQRDKHLTPSEKIDRQLIETWMVLVHRHGLTSLPGVVKSYEVN